MSSGQYTTVSVRESTLARIRSEKPFESMSHDEFLNVLLDTAADEPGLYDWK